MARSLTFHITFRLLLLLKICQIDSALVRNVDEKSKLNIAVIGAGASGLVSAKHSIAHGHDVTVYEQNEELGGVWVYTDQTGKNKYGVNIHTAMYQGLRVNAPYQFMEFPDHHHPNGTTPFPPRSDILKFLHSYADRFDLNKHIKLNHLIIRVLPIENDKWEIVVKDLPNDKLITKIYDAVFVCNGHYFAPRIPEIEGAGEFKGKMIHSHDFRTAEVFRGENVLVIGGGSSGIDLALHLLKAANSVTLSTKKKLNETREERQKRKILLPSNIILRDNVRRFTVSGAEFIDDTRQKFSVIIYATGYKYSFPFLSVDSGIHVEDNFIQPLYKHIFNIQYPTMAFISIPRSSYSFHVFDLQARFAIKFISGEKKLPSKNEMLNDQQIENQMLWNKGFPKSKTHNIADHQEEYQRQLCELADIDNLPKIFHKINDDLHADIMQQPTEFRKFKYTIIDDNTYTKEKYTAKFALGTNADEHIKQ